MIRPVKLFHFWLVAIAFVLAIRQWREAAHCMTSKETELSTSLLCSLSTTAARNHDDFASEESEAHHRQQQQQQQQQQPKQETIVLQRTTKLVVDDQGQQGKLSQRQLDEWLQARSPPAGIRPPRPVQIVHEYIRQHSVVVHGDTSREGQKYMVVAYECPHRAGNVLGMFLNEMLLAVLTNRTAVFHIENELECDPILQRAPWIPRLDSDSEHGKNRFTIEQRNALMRAMRATFRRRPKPWVIQAELISRNTTAAILAQDIGHHPVIELQGTIAGCFHCTIRGWTFRFDWNVSMCREYLSGLFHDDHINSDRAAQLFELGIDFVYGMLFRLSFDLTPGLIKSVSYSSVIDSKAFTVGLHSRHVDPKDDGSDIFHERNCLDRVMERRTPNSACQFLIMSDRPATNRALQAYSIERGCEGIVVQQHAGGNDGQYLANTTGIKGRWQINDEHGPFEGAGFYKDLALIAQARDALVCTTRSSSAIIQQNFVYDSVMRYYESNGGSMEGYESPEICHLPNRLRKRTSATGSSSSSK